ncbi:MAG: phosphoribosylglycinamide formyltransferase [Bacteroidetes bacterium]|nr:phosphoribosylglycinamide formyltransferase [Bacteroidota bacterium]
MINLALFASGSGTNVENLIQYFASSKEVKIKIVITNNPQAGVIKRAEAYKKNVHIISKQALLHYTEQIIDFLKTEKVDVLVLAGFLLKIPEKLVTAFPNRIINIHPALLPKYGGKGMYGMHVHQAVIQAKEKESGITVHYVNEEYDKGAIIMQKTCCIEPHDTPETVAKKIHELEYTYFPKAVEQVVAHLQVK